MLRTVRNIAIILILAVPIALLVAAARQIYREDRLTFDSLPDDQRAVLYGAVGVVVLMIAGAGKLLGGGGLGAVIWVTLMACAVVAIIGVWMRAHSD